MVSRRSPRAFNRHWQNPTIEPIRIRLTTIVLGVHPTTINYMLRFSCLQLTNHDRLTTSVGTALPQRQPIKAKIQ